MSVTLFTTTYILLMIKIKRDSLSLEDNWQYNNLPNQHKKGQQYLLSIPR